MESKQKFSTRGTLFLKYSIYQTFDTSVRNNVWCAFSDFLFFMFLLTWKQIKRDLISSIILVVCDLSNDLRLSILRKLGNIREISKLIGGIAECPVSFPEMRLVIAAKNYTDPDIRYQSFLILSFFAWFFYLVPLVFSEIVPRVMYRCADSWVVFLCGYMNFFFLNNLSFQTLFLNLICFTCFIKQWLWNFFMLHWIQINTRMVPCFNPPASWCVWLEEEHRLVLS